MDPPAQNGPGLALRARIVLACADGRSNTGVAADLRVCVNTVGKWRSRFLEQRLDGLLDQPRSGRPRTIDDADVERVIALTLETTPRTPPTGAPGPWPGVAV